MSDTLKTFAQLHSDYAFFEKHVNETEVTLAAWLPLVGERWETVRALDFGAGSGSFTSAFFERAEFSPDRLHLTLVEPDDGFRTQAVRAVAPYTSHPVRAWPFLDRETPSSFDLIVSHHVLYYVPDLEETLARLCRALRPGGLMLLVQGGQGNGMNKLVFAAFELLGRKSPYRYSEESERILRSLPVSLEVGSIRSVLDFPDSEENRRKVLRFLLSEHLEDLRPDEAMNLFSPFECGDRIHIESRDELFVVRIPIL